MNIKSVLCLLVAWYFSWFCNHVFPVIYGLMDYILIETLVSIKLWNWWLPSIRFHYKMFYPSMLSINMPQLEGLLVGELCQGSHIHSDMAD